MSEQNRVKRAAPWITRRLRLGLHWLWSNERQPRGALIQRDGIWSRVVECKLGIYPDAYRDLPVVILEVSYQFAEHGRPEGRLTTEEVASFTGLVERAARDMGRAKIIERWGGVGDPSVSLLLSRRRGKGTKQLIENRKKGCPRPSHPLFCGWDDCSWFSDGYKKARLPQGWR